MAHGIKVREVPTGVKPAAKVAAGIPVYVGTAPITAGDLAFVNKSAVFYTEAEYAAKCGPITDDFRFTLSEAAKAHFSVYSVAPFIAINVLDPENEDHVASATGESHQLVDGSVKLQTYGGEDEAMLGVIKSTVVVKNLASQTKTLDEDYTLTYDDDGFLVVSTKDGGSIGDDDVILVDFDYLDPSLVVADDIIGGYSAGAYAGLELVKRVAKDLRLVPGLLCAPGWSQDPQVAARLITLAGSIGFRCMAVLDIPTDGTIPTYAEAAAWKSDNGYGSVNAAVGWPKMKRGDDVYHYSTEFACITLRTIAEADGIPFRSPSNKTVTGATVPVLDDGTEVVLEDEQANALNDQGIVTFLNGFSGWKLWGNRTGGYPTTTDPKDAFIAVRLFFNWLGSVIIQTHREQVDDPINRRLIDLVRNTMQTFLDGLVPLGALMSGSRIEFREDENPVVNLAAGKAVWHLTATPPSPGEELEFILEHDPALFAALFG